jgi:hypothetical protein
VELVNDPEVFRRHVNSSFVAQADSVPIALQLVEVADERVGRGMQQFSLFFHGPADRVLPQGIYAFQHEQLGLLEIFIVPVVGSNNERTVYQACFSRPAPPDLT